MMTPEAQRIAIAEECRILQWSYALPKRCVGASVPDYLNDLNAMHEAEKVLSPANQPARGESQWSEYLGWLGFCGKNETREVYVCVTATAAQRAEAFLRTIGKWEVE